MSSLRASPTTNNPVLASARMPQLDGLRAIAIAFVIFHHSFSNLGLWTGIFGGFGVRLFFVLSGFLITRLLVQARDRSPDSPDSILRAFWIRRALRILPLYYASILIFAALNVEHVRSLLVWLLSYSSNVYMALTRDDAIPFSHFWSLAVEEQFYLFSPLLLLFTKPRRLPSLLVALAAVGPAFRILCFYEQWPDQVRWYMTFSSFDSLAIGSLIGVFSVRFGMQTLAQRARDFIPVALIAVFLAEISRFVLFNSAIERTAETLEAFSIAVLIALSASGFRAVRIFELPVLRRVGRISYGLYVYHVFIWYFLHFHLLKGRGDLWTERLIGWTLTWILSDFSYRYFESPINALNFNYPYPNGPYLERAPADGGEDGFTLSENPG